MRGEGLEPSHSCLYQILSLARLPIPPSPQISQAAFTVNWNKMQESSKIDNFTIKIVTNSIKLKLRMKIDNYKIKKLN
jgi:hypothetical protein